MIRRLKTFKPSAPISQGKRIYNTARWRKLSRLVLRQQPMCSICNNSLSRNVDHITPIEMNGAPYDRGNLRGVCIPCHNRLRKEQQNGVTYNMGKRKENKKQVMSIAIDPTLHEQLKEQATMLNTSVSEYVGGLIEHALKNHTCNDCEPTDEVCDE